jgi:hypothetical protein
MSFLKKIFSSKDLPVQSNEEFWLWFEQHEKRFHKTVKSGKNFETGFFNELSVKLGELRPGYFYLVGMCDTDTAELVFTPDGVVKNIVYVEELVKSAPQIAGWKFTALKTPLDMPDLSIKMGPFTFNNTNISFYYLNDPSRPDHIEIVFVYHDYDEDDPQTSSNGTLIFVDNFLGELNFITLLDTYSVIGPKDAQQELIPLEKLKDFLIWREKEFVEKYHGMRKDTELDSHAIFEATLTNGHPIIATINTDLLKWDAKASHPWILSIKASFLGNEFGMPNQTTQDLLTIVENKLLEELRDERGYLYIGHETTNGTREIFFACKDFRKPVKVVDQIVPHYDELNFVYELYKDKYWQTFSHFIN